MSVSGLFLFALAFLGGALIAAQGPIYSRMSQDLGGALTATTIAFVIGAIALFVLVLATKARMPTVEHIMQVPVWVWPGPLIGVFVVLVSVKAVPEIGTTYFIIALILGQVLAGPIYDGIGAFGLAPREFSALNILGLVLVILGVVLSVVPK